MTSCASARSRAPTPPCSTPPRGADRDQRTRSLGVRQEVELFRDKLLYLARGAAIVVFAGSLPRGVEPDLYASLIKELERRDVVTVVDTDGEPLRQAVRAEPDVVSPNVLEAEELVGHEFSGEQERSHAVAEIAALGPREAIMTLSDGCFAQVLIDGQRCSSAPGSSLASRSHAAAPGMRSSPATSQRAMKAARPTSACASGWRAARTRQRAWARG